MSPFQIGFILGRSIQDNIIVTQETLHNMYIARDKQGYFVIKVDLAKAYILADMDHKSKQVLSGGKLFARNMGHNVSCLMALAK